MEIETERAWRSTLPWPIVGDTEAAAWRQHMEQRCVDEVAMHECAREFKSRLRLTDALCFSSAGLEDYIWLWDRVEEAQEVDA